MFMEVEDQEGENQYSDRMLKEYIKEIFLKSTKVNQIGPQTHDTLIKLIILL